MFTYVLNKIRPIRRLITLIICRLLMSWGTSGHLRIMLMVSHSLHGVQIVHTLLHVVLMIALISGCGILRYLILFIFTIFHLLCWKHSIEWCQIFSCLCYAPATNSQGSILIYPCLSVSHAVSPSVQITHDHGLSSYLLVQFLNYI